jgi:uncharacterized protein YaeQ
MALRSTIHKAQLAVADLDRGHYADHALTLARHPSETEERLMVRLLAYALHADPALAFGRGLSSEGEPDLALRDDTGRLRLWIEVGLPDEKWVRKAASQADRVVLIAYGGARAELWWRANAGPLARHDGLSVLLLDEPGTRALAALAARTMNLSVTIQEGQALVSDGTRGAEVAVTVLKPGPTGPSPGTDRW